MRTIQEHIRIARLVVKRWLGALTEEEALQLQAWEEGGEGRAEACEALRHVSPEQLSQRYEQIDSTEEWRVFRQRLAGRRRNLRLRMVGVAAGICLVAGVAFWWQLEQEMEQARYVRQQRVAASLSNAAMIMSNSLSNLNRTSTVMAVVPERETKSHRTVSDRREICSLCNGTGYNPVKERPPFYSYDTETYDHEPCEICGDRSSHYHKKCPKCNGKGFLLN